MVIGQKVKCEIGAVGLRTQDVGRQGAVQPDAPGPIVLVESAPNVRVQLLVQRTQLGPQLCHAPRPVRVLVHFSLLLAGVPEPFVTDNTVNRHEKTIRVVRGSSREYANSQGLLSPAGVLTTQLAMTITKVYTSVCSIRIYLIGRRLVQEGRSLHGKEEMKGTAGDTMLAKHVLPSWCAPGVVFIS